jgi:uncharacterized tellurite resistance protein B-like protein
MSLKSLARAFSEAPQRRREEQEAEHQKMIRLATAAVLLEVAYADSKMSMKEQETLLTHLQDDFELSKEEARELVEAAEELRADTIDHFHLTNVVRKSCSLDDRIDIVKTMWRIVYVDGELHQYEGYIVRKLADLLGLEHSVMIEAKLAVQDELRG